MTQATTTTVLKIQLMYGILHQHSTNTSTAGNTSSIKVDITDTMVYAITMCTLVEFLLVWLVTI